MGWTSFNYRKATHSGFNKLAAADFITSEFYNYGCAMAQLHKDRDQHELYMILRSANGTPFICVCLVSIKDDEIYFKEMSESEGPCYHNCPKEFFKFVSVPDSEFAKEWRDECIKQNIVLDQINFN
jgi:hypothetical protein